MKGELLEVLRQARSLVAAGWCQQTSARKRDGTPVSCSDPDAARFCASGAVWSSLHVDHLDRTVQHSLDAAAYSQLLQALRALHPEEIKTLEGWNDTPGRKKSQVLQVYDRAIATLEAARQ